MRSQCFLLSCGQSIGHDEQVQKGSSMFLTLGQPGEPERFVLQKWGCLRERPAQKDLKMNEEPWGVLTRLPLRKCCLWDSGGSHCLGHQETTSRRAGCAPETTAEPTRGERSGSWEPELRLELKVVVARTDHRKVSCREVAVASGNRAEKSQGPPEFSNLPRLLSQVMSQPAPVPLTRAGGRPWPPSEQTLSLFRERVAWEGKLQKELKTQCHGQLFYCEHGTF
ncbi:uncharacterized protein LOC125161005 [Prionailurus viverrinus]|uniref:uncharacterized protein LOC125161005 n=1 Tax=Prionailurus viverrinus TaxID=61388 RepID=UPI001FF1DF26|nr:uncharacterized protein LOC125161005 [Prionailurus viverrinus]